MYVFSEENVSFCKTVVSHGSSSLGVSMAARYALPEGECPHVLAKRWRTRFSHGSPVTIPRQKRPPSCCSCLSTRRASRVSHCFSSSFMPGEAISGSEETSTLNKSHVDLDVPRRKNTSRPLRCQRQGLYPRKRIALRYLAPSVARVASGPSNTLPASRTRSGTRGNARESKIADSPVFTLLNTPERVKRLGMSLRLFLPRARVLCYCSPLFGNALRTTSPSLLLFVVIISQAHQLSVSLLPFLFSARFKVPFNSVTRGQAQKSVSASSGESETPSP